MHCFELRTLNVDYMVGADPLIHLTGNLGSAALPPPDSGVGAYLAKSWETAIRQALMPVTQQSGIYFLHIFKCIVHHFRY